MSRGDYLQRYAPHLATGEGPTNSAPRNSNRGFQTENSGVSDKEFMNAASLPCQKLEEKFRCGGNALTIGSTVLNMRDSDVRKAVKDWLGRSGQRLASS